MAEGFPRATLKRIMKELVDEGRYDFRISQDAVDFLNLVISGYIKDIMLKARYNAQKHGRRTIKEEDIRAAFEEVFKFVRASELSVKT